MIQRILVSALAVAALGSLISCGSGEQETARLYSVPASNRVDGRYIVVMQESAKANLNSLAAQHVVGHRYHNVFNGFSTSLSKDELKNLLQNPGVQAVYEVGRVHLSAVQENPTWGIDRLDQASASLDKKYKYGASGKGVTAYVIDTGVTVSHPDFGGRAVAGADLTKDKGTSYENVDGHGHGTHVSGTIGSATWGVAKDVKIVGVKVFDHTGGEASDETVIAGIDWVIAAKQANPGPSVINMSLGGSSSDVLDDAVRLSVELGITTVVSAGNENQDACNVSPAREPAAITVAAMGQGDRKSSFSNWGRCTDVIAPGSGITSTTKNGRTASMDGTSMASPHVAGVAAVVLSAFPQKNPAEVQQYIIDSSLQGKATGFSAETPNRIASVIWNVPAPQAGDPWSESFAGNAAAGQKILFPTEKGFEAVAGNTVVATLAGSGWFGGGNCDLFLKKIGADGVAVTVASSQGNGMSESVKFAVAERGRYIIEVSGISGGKFTLKAQLK